VSRAVALIRRGFRRQLRIRDIAAAAGMSESSLYEHFKTITRMTPLEYQKRLRLQEARRLMLAEGTGAGSAGFAVGSGRLVTWLGCSPHTASPEDVRQFQIEQQQAGVPATTMNSIVAALRFFFTHTLDRPDLARRLVRAKHARKMPVVLTMAEVKRHGYHLSLKMRFPAVSASEPERTSPSVYSPDVTKARV